MTPQSTPAGALVTVPIPVPLGTTVTAKLCTAKVAVTVVAAVTVTTQECVPVQASPLQPVKTDAAAPPPHAVQTAPAAGVAVSATGVPRTKLAVQLAPQSMPAGVLDTIPAPAPGLETVRTKVGVNVAVTAVAAVWVTMQGPVPLH